MGCLKLNAAMKQCLQKENGHDGDCIFTLLKPEVAAAQDLRKERDNQLTRRNLADGYMRAFAPDIGELAMVPGAAGVFVDNCLALADDLIKKTGGFGP